MENLIHPLKLAQLRIDELRNDRDNTEFGEKRNAITREIVDRTSHFFKLLTEYRSVSEDNSDMYVAVEYTDDYLVVWDSGLENQICQLKIN